MTADRADAPASAFDAAVAVAPVGPGTWRGTVAEGWDIGGAPNGGYVLALGLEAVLAALDVPDPLTATAHYLAPPRPGPVDVHVEVVRTGRRHRTAAAALRQAGAEVVRLLATCTDLARADGPRHVTVEPPELPPPEACVVARPTASFTPPAITERVRLALHPRHVGFAAGTPTGTAEIAGWARFADGREPDTRSLPLFADALPPAVFNLDLPPSWVPTIELTVHVRARPVPGWLRAVFSSRVVSGGYFEEDGEIWDSAGTLVAQSRQLALAPRG